jgi:hypothetical protein
MSRWQSEFDSHPFQTEWVRLIGEALPLSVDDETILTSVQELARLKRVIEFLRSAISNIDAELVPKSVWDNFHGQCAPCLQLILNFKSDRSIAHLVAANLHLDNLLSYVRPYLILPEKVMGVLNSSAATYRLQLEEYVNAFLKKSVTSSKQIDGRLKESNDLLNQLQTNKDRIDALVVDLLDGTPEKTSIQNDVSARKEKIDKQASEISAFHEMLLIDTPETPSTKTAVEAAKKEIIAGQKQTRDAILDTETQISNLGNFHGKIFGSKDADGKVTDGLKKELDDRLTQLGKFEGDQMLRHQTLFQTIEDLIPGATSAGLASAYKELRDSFTLPILINSLLFYVAVLMMLVVAVLSSIDQFSYSPFALKFVSHSNIDAIFQSALLKLPFIAPLVWLAVFASARRSQYERLQQEYAHKEALAKSYESYRKQLLALMVSDSEPLQKELISKAIEALSFNASTTLDGRHRDKMPIDHAIEVLFGEKGKGALEGLRSLISGNNPKPP